MLSLAWSLVCWSAALVLETVDDLLVISRLKWRDSMGRTRWRWNTAWRCINCSGPLAPCDCHTACPGGMCTACEPRSR